MGKTYGCSEKKDACRMPRLSRCHPRRKTHATVFKDWSPESHVRRKRSCVVRRQADRKVLHKVTRWRPSLPQGDGVPRVLNCSR
jgi:hypothetical protein